MNHEQSGKKQENSAGTQNREQKQQENSNFSEMGQRSSELQHQSESTMENERFSKPYGERAIPTGDNGIREDDEDLGGRISVLSRKEENRAR